MILSIKTASLNQDLAVLEVCPEKVKVLLNGNIMEDTTASETPTSYFFKKTRIKIKKTGQITEFQAGEGVINLTPMLNIFPVWPDKLIPGTRWMQAISTPNLGLLPALALKYNYLFEGISKIAGKATAVIRINANQPLAGKEKIGEGHTELSGRNKMDGVVYFNPEIGQIEKIEGKLDLALNSRFVLPKTSEVKDSRSQNYSLRNKMNLKFSSTKL